MEKKKYDLKEVEHIQRLKDEFRGVLEGYVPVLKSLDDAKYLLDGLKKYPEAFKTELGFLEHQINKEEKSSELVNHLIVVRNPVAIMSRFSMTNLEWRMQCVMLYESLSEQEREELLKDCNLRDFRIA